jgi:Protein of unknown function (DUF3631)
MSDYLLINVRDFVRRFVVLSDEQADTLALWCAHTHALDAAESTPYLAITSPEKRSGKTRLLEVLELVVHEGLPTSNISDAALFRSISELNPTLLMDEVDAIFSAKARDREDLRGLLNAGYRRGAVVRRMGGAKMTTLEVFPVFCAKAFAGIGNCLPDTILDRSIGIALQRKTREETVERFRRREVVPEGETLRDRLADWLEPQIDYISALRPSLPDELDDRAQDMWEPLLAIADLAEGDWPERAWKAALKLSGNGAREDDSLTAILLRDIYYIFEETGAEGFKTSDLIFELCRIEESPWGDWRGKSITPHALSRLLKPHRIKTMPLRVEGEVVRGYKRAQFDDATHRVLGVTGVTGVTSKSTSQAGCNARNACNASGTGEGPLPGDGDFLDFIAAGHRDGRITTEEALARGRVHELVERAKV